MLIKYNNAEINDFTFRITNWELSFRNWGVFLILIYTTGCIPVTPLYLSKDIKSLNFLADSTFIKTNNFIIKSNAIYHPFFFNDSKREAEINYRGSLYLYDSLIVFEDRGAGFHPSLPSIQPFKINLQDLIEYSVFDDAILLWTKTKKYCFLTEKQIALIEKYEAKLSTFAPKRIDKKKKELSDDDAYH